MSPVRLSSCTNCGHRFEKSRIVADSRLTMTLCSRCGSDQVEIAGDGLRGSRACWSGTDGMRATALGGDDRSEARGWGAAEAAGQVSPDGAARTR